MKKLLSSSLLAVSAAAFLPAWPGVVLAVDAAQAPAEPVAGQAAADADAAAPAQPAAPEKKPGKTAKTGKSGKGKSGAKAAGKAGKDGKASSEPAGVSEAIRDEMGKLVEQAIQVASPDLQKSDRFLPYGVLKMDDGALNVVRWQLPTAPPDLAVLAGIVRAMQVEIRKNPHVVAAVTVATAAVPTVDGKVMVSGIRAEVDHRKGVPQIVFIPYTKENGKLILGTLVYAPGVNPLFDHGPPAPAPGTSASAPASTPAPSAPPAASPVAPAPATGAEPSAPAPATAAPAKP